MFAASIPAILTSDFPNSTFTVGSPGRIIVIGHLRTALTIADRLLGCAGGRSHPCHRARRLRLTSAVGRQIHSRRHPEADRRAERRLTTVSDGESGQVPVDAEAARAEELATLTRRRDRPRGSGRRYPLRSRRGPAVARGRSARPAGLRRRRTPPTAFAGPPKDHATSRSHVSVATPTPAGWPGGYDFAMCRHVLATTVAGGAIVAHCARGPPGVAVYLFYVDATRCGVS